MAHQLLVFIFIGVFFSAQGRAAHAATEHPAPHVQMSQTSSSGGLGNVKILAISQDKRLLATEERMAAQSGVTLWDLGTGLQMARLPGEGKPGFSPDGKFIATTDHLGEVVVRDLETLSLRFRAGLWGYRFSDRASFSRDGQLLLIESSEHGLLRLALKERMPAEINADTVIVPAWESLSCPLLYSMVPMAPARLMCLLGGIFCEK